MSRSRPTIYILVHDFYTLVRQLCFIHNVQPQSHSHESGQLKIRYWCYKVISLHKFHEMVMNYEDGYIISYHARVIFHIDTRVVVIFCCTEVTLSSHNFDKRRLLYVWRQAYDKKCIRKNSYTKYAFPV